MKEILNSLLDKSNEKRRKTLLLLLGYVVFFLFVVISCKLFKASANENFGIYVFCVVFLSVVEIYVFFSELISRFVGYGNQGDKLKIRTKQGLETDIEELNSTRK